jgi:hypothetical protein
MEEWSVEKNGRKKCITERNRRRSWERQGIVALCTCQWNEWIKDNVKWPSNFRLDCKLFTARLSPLANVFCTCPFTLLQPLVYGLKKSIILCSQFVRELRTKQWHLVPLLGRDVAHSPEVLSSVLSDLTALTGRRTGAFVPQGRSFSNKNTSFLIL